MTAKTIEVPIARCEGGEDPSYWLKHGFANLPHREVSGEVVGPFLIHRDLSGRGWAVSHIATGFSVHWGMDPRARAMWLARQLESLGGWDFTDPRACLQQPDQWRLQVQALRADATWSQRPFQEAQKGEIGNG